MFDLWLLTCDFRFMTISWGKAKVMDKSTNGGTGLSEKLKTYHYPDFLFTTTIGTF